MTSRKGMRYEKDGQCRDNKNDSCFFVLEEGRYPDNANVLSILSY